MEASQQTGLLKLLLPKAPTKAAMREGDPEGQKDAETGGFFDRIFGEAVDVDLSDGARADQTRDNPARGEIFADARPVQIDLFEVATHTPVSADAPQPATKRFPELVNVAEREIALSPLTAPIVEPEVGKPTAPVRTEREAALPNIDVNAAPIKQGQPVKTIKLGGTGALVQSAPPPESGIDAPRAALDGAEPVTKPTLKYGAAAFSAPAALASPAATASFAATPQLFSPVYSDAQITGEFDISLDPALSTSSRTTGQGAIVPIAAPVTANPAMPGVIPQILAAIQARQGGDTIEIRLDPPELGRILIDFTVEGPEAVKAVLTAERGETLDHLRRHIADLEAQLRNAGFGSVSFEFQDRGQDQFSDEKTQRADSNRETGLVGDQNLRSDKIYLTMRDGAQLNLLV